MNEAGISGWSGIIKPLLFAVENRFMIVAGEVKANARGIPEVFKDHRHQSFCPLRPFSGFAGLDPFDYGSKGQKSLCGPGIIVEGTASAGVFSIRDAMKTIPV